MKTKINLIICPNGFGHFRRLNTIIDIIDLQRFDVTIFTDKDAISRFHKRIKLNLSKEIKIKNVPNLPISLDYQVKTSNKILDIFNFIDDFDKDSLIISDNYPEVFKFKDNGILLANFFWHKEISKFIDDKSYNFINSPKKRFITLGTIFSKSYIKSLKNFSQIGLFGNKKVSAPKKNNRILFVQGKGVWTVNYPLLFKRYIEKYLTKYDGEIVIDELLENFEHPNLSKDITYSSAKDFKNLDKFDFVIGRPSLGIVTDCLERNISFIPIYDKEDNEANHNAKIITDFYMVEGLDVTNMDHLLKNDSKININVSFSGAADLMNKINFMTDNG